MTAINELDAARECVMAYGLRHTTFSDVARRAGLSRKTLYSRYPDLNALLAALIAHDFDSVIEDTLTELQHLPNARERLVEALTQGAARMTNSALFQKILETDPEAILPYVTDHVGRTQRVVIAGITALIHEGHGDASIRSGEPNAMACAIELALRSYVFSGHMRHPACPREQALRELHTMLDRYLRPDTPDRPGV